jgi:DNA-binding phage protein
MTNKKVISIKGNLTDKRAKRQGNQQREYIVHDWALIHQAGGCYVSRTAKTLGISRSTLIRYLKADDELKTAFDDMKMSEYDDVRSGLVKLALAGHFHAIRLYLENRGCFSDFTAKDDEADDSNEETRILESMTTEEKAAAYAAMLEEDEQLIKARQSV